MFALVDAVAVGDRAARPAAFAPQVGFRHALDQHFVAQAVEEHLLDRDEPHCVAGGEIEKPCAAGDVTRLVENGANGCGRKQPRQPHHVERRLHDPGPIDHAAGRNLDRRDVSRHRQILRTARLVDRDADRRGPVRRRNPRRYAATRLERRAVGNPVGDRTVLSEQRNPQAT